MAGKWPHGTVAPPVADLRPAIRASGLTIRYGSKNRGRRSGPSKVGAGRGGGGAARPERGGQRPAPSKPSRVTGQPPPGAIAVLGPGSTAPGGPSRLEPAGWGVMLQRGGRLFGDGSERGRCGCSPPTTTDRGDPTELLERFRAQLPSPPTPWKRLVRWRATAACRWPWRSWEDPKCCSSTRPTAGVDPGWPAGLSEDKLPSCAAAGVLHPAHEPTSWREAERVADRIVILSRGPGWWHRAPLPPLAASGPEGARIRFRRSIWTGYRGAEPSHGSWSHGGNDRGELRGRGRPATRPRWPG